MLAASAIASRAQRDKSGFFVATRRPPAIVGGQSLPE
jgi:hypothetical protein